jgi:hypothetical protein
MLSLILFQSGSVGNHSIVLSQSVESSKEVSQAIMLHLLFSSSSLTNSYADPSFYSQNLANVITSTDLIPR